MSSVTLGSKGSTKKPGKDERGENSARVADSRRWGCEGAPRGPDPASNSDPERDNQGGWWCTTYLVDGKKTPSDAGDVRSSAKEGNQPRKDYVLPRGGKRRVRTDVSR